MKKYLFETLKGSTIIMVDNARAQGIAGSASTLSLLDEEERAADIRQRAKEKDTKDRHEDAAQKTKEREVKFITVRSKLPPRKTPTGDEHLVALHEKDADHPMGEVFVYGPEPVLVAQTAAVSLALAQGKLEEVKKGEHKSAEGEKKDDNKGDDKSKK